jgi:hypothetical protein
MREQKKRPLSWVDLELPFMLHMTNKYLAIPFPNSDIFHEPHELRCTVFVELQMNIELHESSPDYSKLSFKEISRCPYKLS